jgi:hypothetical protein
MHLVHRHRGEAALPEIATPAFPEIHKARIAAVGGTVARRFPYDQNRQPITYWPLGSGSGAPPVAPDGSASLHWGPEGHDDTPAYGSYAPPVGGVT